MDVEYMSRVAETVRFSAQESRRFRFDLELQKPLTPIVARLQTKQHDALPCRRYIEVAGDVLDSILDGSGHGVSAPENLRWRN